MFGETENLLSAFTYWHLSRIWRKKNCWWQRKIPFLHSHWNTNKHPNAAGDQREKKSTKLWIYYVLITSNLRLSGLCVCSTVRLLFPHSAQHPGRAYRISYAPPAHSHISSLLSHRACLCRIHFAQGARHKAGRVCAPNHSAPRPRAIIIATSSHHSLTQLESVCSIIVFCSSLRSTSAHFLTLYRGAAIRCSVSVQCFSIEHIYSRYMLVCLRRWALACIAIMTRPKTKQLLYIVL